jgi:hypothetical protein
MVELCRTASDFGISRMRESFMRQFVEQGPDANLGDVINNNDVSAPKDVTGMLSAGAPEPERVQSVPPLMSFVGRCKAMTSAFSKHSGVSDIIR